MNDKTQHFQYELKTKGLQDEWKSVISQNPNKKKVFKKFKIKTMLIHFYDNKAIIYKSTYRSHHEYRCLLFKCC